jgi:hypothetical protein
MLGLVAAGLLVVHNNCWLQVTDVRQTTAAHNRVWLETSLRNPSQYQTDQVWVSYRVRTPSQTFWSAPLQTPQTFPGYSERTVRYLLPQRTTITGIGLYCL